METKMKIIIIVFVGIFLLYAGHFLYTQMLSSPTKERFIADYDDVENYEDPVPKKEQSKTVTPIKQETEYDQRVLVLDDIDKLKISDKDIKGKLMEYMFTEAVLEKVSSMSNTERSSFVQSKYDILTSGGSLSEEKKVTEEKEKVKDTFLDEDSKQVSSKDSELNETIMSKTNDAMTQLKAVETTLMDIKKSINVKSKATTPQGKVTATQSDPKEGYKEPELPTLPEIPGFPVIEGFENIRNFASVF